MSYVTATSKIIQQETSSSLVASGHDVSLRPDRARTDDSLSHLWHDVLEAEVHPEHQDCTVYVNDISEYLTFYSPGSRVKHISSPIDHPKLINSAGKAVRGNLGSRFMANDTLECRWEEPGIEPTTCWSVHDLQWLLNHSQPMSALLTLEKPLPGEIFSNANAPHLET